MNERIRNLLVELKAGLAAIYAGRFCGVYLYGSYARGEEDGESDVDVLIVLDNVARYAPEVDRTGHLVSTLALKYEVSISRVFVSQENWATRKTPFLINAREEAVSA